MTRPTQVPGIPRPPSRIDAETKRYLEALAEAVEIRLGRRGDPIDRAVTLRELIDSGLAKSLASNPYDPNNPGSSPGFGPDPVVNPGIPTAPTGLTANGAYSQINLFWDMPVYGNHGNTELWSHPSDSIGDATLTGVSSGKHYIDAVGSSVTRYYWVRHVSTSGVIGPYNATAGTGATTAADVEHLLDVLNESITSSELATDLSTPIGNLPQNTALAISNETTARSAALVTEATARAAALTAESTARAAAIVASAATLQGQIDDLLDIAAYDNATAYATNDQVTYNSKLYKASQATTGNLPTNTTYWALLGNYTSLGAAVGSNSAAIIQIDTVSASSGSAAARALHGIQAAVNDGTTGLAVTRASLLNDYYTSATTDTAIASATSTLVSTTTLGNYTTTAGLTTNYYTKTDADSAISSATQGLVSTTTLGNYTTTAGLTTNYYTKTDADSAISSAVTGLVSVSGLATALGSYPTTATLTTDYYTKTAADSAISSAVQNLVSTTTLGNYTTTAGLTTNYYTKTDADSAISSAVTGLVSTTTLGNYTTTAGLTTNYYTKTDADSAISSATQSLVSTTGLATALGSYPTTATLTNDYYTKTAADSAISSAVTGLVATTTLADYTTTSTLTTNHYTKTAADSAISTAVQNLVSTTALADYTTTSTLNTNHYTKTAADLAISGAITNLSSGFNDPDGTSSLVTLQQAMTTQASLNGTLKSSYAVKIDVNGAIAGFGLSSTTNSLGTNESEFIINADRFALMRGGSDTSTAVTPFTVQANDTTINGTLVPAGVYMDAAFIKTATITSAMIGSIDANSITSGTINAGYIYGGTIDAANVTIAGVSPSFEIKSASTGARMEIKADVIKVFDSNNQLRVKLGNLT